MNILVIGSKGMLGQDIVDELSKKNMHVTGWGSEDVDITKEEDITKIEQQNPDILINCAAYTKVDLAEKEREKCRAVNVTGVKNITAVCKKKEIVFIQISTDYVFDGNQESYDENDQKNPINYYGKTKSDGEDIIIKNLNKYYIIRTSWLFGKKGNNFVEKIIQLCGEKKYITVVNDQKGSPTYTRDLAKGILNMISAKKDFGIYHLTNSGVCTWYDFAREITMLKKLKCEIHPCTSEQFVCDAKRPKYSILNNNKTEKMRHWEDALRSYLEE